MSRNPEYRVWVALATTITLLTLTAFWLTGTFDRQLYPLHLNVHPCLADPEGQHVICGHEIAEVLAPGELREEREGEG
jgi:hypothetical protein